MKGDKIFLDSSILCYAADIDDKVRHLVAQHITEELQHSGHGYISTQVLQETYNVITKKLKFPIHKAREFIDFVRCLEVHVNTADDIMSAIDISEKHQMFFLGCAYCERSNGMQMRYVIYGGSKQWADDRRHSSDKPI